MQVKQFIDLVDGDKSLYGLKKETLNSLLLSLLPPYGHTYKDTPPGDLIGDDIKLCLLQELLRTLRNSAGFAVPLVRHRRVYDLFHLYMSITTLMSYFLVTNSHFASCFALYIFSENWENLRIKWVTSNFQKKILIGFF